MLKKLFPIAAGAAASLYAESRADVFKKIPFVRELPPRVSATIVGILVGLVAETVVRE